MLSPVLRILHVLCDLNGGGAERVVLDLCRFASPGFAHRVATVHAGGPMEAVFAEAGIPVLDAGRARGRPGVRATARIAGWARESDVVHTHLWAGDTWGRIGALLARNPCVVTTEHNVAGEDRWRRSVSRVLVRASAVVACVSEAAAAAAIEAGAPRERIRVIPNGIDLDRFRPAPLPEDPAIRVLAIGRLVRQKGIDVLCEAMRRCPGVELDVLGDGPERSDLERLGVARLHGFVADVRPWLARAHVLAIPSRWEGFGLAAAEAMAAGVPVVASRIPALEEVVGDAGVLVPPEDPVALARALGALLDDAARRSDLRTRGLDRVRRFDVQRTVAGYEAVYRDLTAARRLSPSSS